MLRKSLVSFLISLSIVALLFSACSGFGQKEVVISLSASSDISGLNAARAVNPGDAVTTIDSYRVLFKKVEIGNSEADKFTLWESAEGEEKDIASAISFSNVQPVLTGTYAYVRLTIGPVLNVDGSIDDAGTIYSGTGSASLDKTVYIWGAGINEAASLSQEIVVEEGASMAFEFDIANTISYLSGPADAALLAVTKPNLSVVIE